MRELNLFAMLLLTTASLSFSAVAGDDFSDKEKNICDRLINQGASKKDVEICFKEFGKSKYRKAAEKAARARGEEIAATATEAANLRASKEAERKKYIIQKFEGSELKYLGYAHYVAVKYTDESMGSDETVDKKMTSPQELCVQLGFEDAVSDKEGAGYKLSDRISDYNNPDFQGIYVNWNGKKKEVKWDDHDPASVKYYTAVVCKRLRQTDEQAQSQEIQDALRLMSDAQARVENDDRDGEEQVDIDRSESELMVRRLLESRRNGSGSSDRFTHKGKSK